MHGVDKAHFLENSAVDGAEELRCGQGRVLGFTFPPPVCLPNQRTLPQARDIVVPFSEKTGGQSFEEQN